VKYSGRALRDLHAAGWEITETLHPGGSTADWHAHEVGHFCLVVAGALVDEGQDTSRECGPGILLYFPPGVPHRDRFLGAGARCLNLRPPARRGGGPRSGDGDGSGPVPRAEALDRVLVCGERASWLASGVYDRLRVDGERAIPSGRQLADLFEATAPLDRPRPAPAPRWLDRARTLIEDEWTDDARLGTVAERVGVSRFHLARRFRERFGCSVGQYVQRLRVTRARDLLLASDASLSSIAFATGFADQSHFTRVFGRHVGTSPDRYRRAG